MIKNGKLIKHSFLQRTENHLYIVTSVPCVLVCGKGSKPAFPHIETVSKRISDRLEVTMQFFISMNPPTATAQMKQVRVVKNKPMFYDPPAVKEAKNTLLAHLSVHRPKEPMTGPITLRALWLFPKGKSHKNGEWRITRPDTDNLQKMLKDCMTQCKFWKDDAQVVREIAEKRWSDEPCGIYIEVDEMEDSI